MKKLGFTRDERSEQVDGRSATVVLGLTQIALCVLLLIRLYIRNQPDEELRDFQWLLFGSIVGYFMLRSFLGGMMPVPNLKQAFIVYLSMFTVLFVVLSLWFGLPELKDWATTILPVTLGPALVVGGYWLIAFLGQKRIEREMDLEDRVS